MRFPPLALVVCGFLLSVSSLAAAAPGPDETKPPDDKLVIELVKRARPSVVVITFDGRDGRKQGLGAGFILTADGLIATNLHVIGEARPITVTLADGRQFPVKSVHASDRTLDLALLKIDGKGLPALDLGDSDALKNGQTVVALGHPRGLKHSVVRGVVSGRPTIDGRPMIQIAIPVEPGNSGGPLLDLQGRVQGVLTLKSQVTPNLGFAMPAKAVQALVRKPNPIAMSRWVTIGTLNRDDWTTFFEGRWRQRNGRVIVDGPGSGFGGRTLCLSKLPVPAVPFEVGVTVRLEPEAGAGGLAFHADGGNRHYGFYPSAGKLRLSRFEGPDVFSWKVLEEKPSPHYRPGEWNVLKVRVEKDKIRCYVNDHLVIELAETGLTEGKVGLVKFRDTHVEFKNFALGKTVPTARPAPDLLARVGKLVEGIPAAGAPRPDLVERLMPDAPASQAALEERARLLEQQAVRLRELAQAVHEKRVTDELNRVLRGEDGKVDLVHAALLVSFLDNPELDVASYRRQVDRLAREVAAAMPKGADEKTKLAVLNRELFEQRGFHGSRGDYYNRANSYLNEVLDDREGLPITLSVLYLELARRLGVEVVGIGLPGHFVVQHRPAKGKAALIDVYEGGKPLTRAEANRKVRAITGAPLREEDLAAVPKKAIVIRMLENLAAGAERSEQLRTLLRYQNVILALAPDRVQDRLRRAGARYQTGDHTGALEDIDWLLKNAPEDVNRERLLELRRFITRPK
jgi:regulator of sirC expression with transglutaminase-like and TPR domain